MSVVAVAAVVGAAISARPPAAAPRTPDGFQRGVALGLFATDLEWDYGDLLREIRALGATDVELVVPWEQPDLEATTIAPRAGPCERDYCIWLLPWSLARMIGLNIRDRSSIGLSLCKCRFPLRSSARIAFSALPDTAGLKMMKYFLFADRAWAR